MRINLVYLCHFAFKPPCSEKIAKDTFICKCPQICNSSSKKTKWRQILHLNKFRCMQWRSIKMSRISVPALHSSMEGCRLINICAILLRPYHWFSISCIFLHILQIWVVSVTLAVSIFCTSCFCFSLLLSFLVNWLEDF